VPAIRRAVSRYARAAGATPRALQKMRLAITEATTNVVLHAFPPGTPPGRIHVYAELLDHEHLRIVIGDDGHGMRERPESPGLGLGLPLMSEFSAEMEIVAGPEGGTDVRMDFQLAA
jgi:serine/threonine-protein kinase RsbW/stage II sporulation protein AB (anti-sigma F factor)